MEDISKILREARPLYFARKRRRRIMAASASLAAVFAIIFNVVFVSPQDEPLYDLWSEQIYMTENGSVIEDMGLPVDEYGLLMVG